MALRKCYVCNSKSSSCWFSLSAELFEDVSKCFLNVQKREISCEGCLCAPCRRNLTRWRESGKTPDGKYFVKTNSRGKPCVTNANIARENRKAAMVNFKKTSSFESSLLLFSFPEDLLLDIAALLSVSDVCSLRQTCKRLNQICASNYLWKILLQRDFTEKRHLLDDSVLSNSLLAYKLFFSATLFTRQQQQSHHAQMLNFRENERKLIEENENIKTRLASLQVKLHTLQTDQNPSTPVTKLQDQVTNIFIYKPIIKAYNKSRTLENLQFC